MSGEAVKASIGPKPVKVNSIVSSKKKCPFALISDIYYTKTKL